MTLFEELLKARCPHLCSDAGCPHYRWVRELLLKHVDPWLGDTAEIQQGRETGRTGRVVGVSGDNCLVIEFPDHTFGDVHRDRVRVTALTDAVPLELRKGKQ